MVDLSKAINRATMNEIESYMSDRKREQIRQELINLTPRDMIEAYLAYDPEFEEVLTGLFHFQSME